VRNRFLRKEEEAGRAVRRLWREFRRERTGTGIEDQGDSQEETSKGDGGGAARKIEGKPGVDEISGAKSREAVRKESPWL
jgi:hypothetical protein